MADECGRQCPWTWLVKDDLVLADDLAAILGGSVNLGMEAGTASVFDKALGTVYRLGD